MWFPRCCFWCRDKGSNEQSPTGPELLFKYTSLQKLLLLKIKPLLGCAQEIIQRFLAVDAHPVRQHHQPPDAFADFMLQTGFIRITDRPTSLLRHGQAPNQARIRQKRQRIILHGPFTAVVLHFQ